MSQDPAVGVEEALDRNGLSSLLLINLPRKEAIIRLRHASERSFQVREYSKGQVKLVAVCEYFFLDERYVKCEECRGNRVNCRNYKPVFMLAPGQ